MRQTIALLIMAGIIIIFTSVMFSRNFSSSDKKVKKDLKDLTSINFDYEYPESPLGVVDLFNKGVRFLYGTLDDADNLDYISDAVDVQRELMDHEFLDINQRDEMILLVKTEIETFKEAKVKIIRLDSFEAQNENNIAVVRTIIYTNNTGKMYREYGLRKDAAGRWKIYGFKEIPEFGHAS